MTRNALGVARLDGPGSWKTILFGQGAVRPAAPVTPFVEFDPTLNFNTVGWILPLGINDVGGPNVGPRPGTVFSAHSGDYTVPGINHTIPSGTEIFGDLIVPTGYTGCYGEDLIIHGTLKTTAAGYAARGSSFNAGGLHLKWCRFDGALNAPQPWNFPADGVKGAWQNGMGGGNYNLEYCEIRRFVDGVSMNNTGNGRLYACRIYEGVYRSYFDSNDLVSPYSPVPGYSWPVHSDQAVHGDAIQVSGYDGWEILGCNIGGPREVAANRGTQLDPRNEADMLKIRAMDATPDFKNAGLMVGSAFPGTDPVGLEMSYCRLQGSAATINLDAKIDPSGPDDYLTGVSIHHIVIGQTDGYRIYKRAAGTPDLDLTTIFYEPTGENATTPNFVRTY